MKKKELKKLRRKANESVLSNASWAAKIPEEFYQYLKAIEIKVWGNDR